MKYIKSYETLYKIYKDNEPIEVSSFTGDDTLDISNIKKDHKEIYNKYKFKINDYVKYSGTFNWVDSDDVYQIKTIDIEKFEKLKKRRIYCIYSITNEKIGVWVYQGDLKKATQDDIENLKIKNNADKYNL